MDYRIPKFLVFNLFVCVLVVIISLQLSQSCNEAVCGSIVSKCMITQACNCGLKNCTCCKDCFSCLSTLYSECCSCVDLCPKPNYTQKSDLSRISHVEELPEPVPELFKLLTAEPDTEQRWITFTFPVDHAISHFHPQLEKEIKYRTKTAEQEVYPEKDMITLNCSVAYMSQCLSWNKCKGSCRSMGAASYRWFHDGCCQCIGDKCINYGINESRCLQCPPVKDKLLVETEVDYGEEEEEMQMEKE